MSAPGFFDPYNHISYVELNKRRRGDYQRDESERIENRTGKPSVKKIYVKRNGEAADQKPKLFVWREWKSPGLQNLLQEVGPYAGLDEGAAAMYDLHGRRIMETDDVRELGTYYVIGDETLLIPESEDEYDSRRRNSYDRNDRRGSEDRYETKSRMVARHTSLSAPDYPTQSRHTLYEGVSYPPTPPPKPYYSALELDEPVAYTSPHTSQRRTSQFPTTSKIPPQRKQRNLVNARELDEFEKFYQEATGSLPTVKKRLIRARKQSRKPQHQDDEPSPRRYEERYRSRSANDDLDERNVSDFDHHDWLEKDKLALAKHKQKHLNRTRSNSAVIYNRRDQTHPDAYIVYVFLNGHGMECQYVNFQKKQLEKGMNYVMELIARRFNVNPAKLCNMDGKKIVDVADLMSRGSYVLVPAGQSFRDTWYFLPDNAIDTSSNQHRVDERSAQRDRLIQRRDKRQTTKEKTSPGFSSKPPKGRDTYKDYDSYPTNNRRR